jgi:hypothetical protein
MFLVTSGEKKSTRATDLFFISKFPDSPDERSEEGEGI